MAGFSALPENANIHAVFWKTPKAVVDLGALQENGTSYGNGINDEEQIVGHSCGARTCVAFLWQNGVMTDLNTLILVRPYD